MIDKKYIKELKRRRMLAKRVKCHGNKFHCSIAHPVSKPVFVAPAVQKKKESWFIKLLKFLRII